MDNKSLKSYYKGVEALKNNEYDKAINYFTDSLDCQEHYKTYYQIGMIFKEKGDKEKALSNFKKSFELNNNNDKSAFEYAKMLLEFKEDKEAIIILKSITRRNSSYKPAVNLLKTLDS